MKIFKHLTLVFISCIIVMSAFACSNNGNKTNNNSSDNSSATLDGTSEAQTALPPNKIFELPDMTWGGRNFNVLGLDSERDQFDTFEVFVESDSADLIESEVYKRNSIIETKYDVTISQSLVTENYVDGTIYEIRRAHQSGESFYDLAFCPLSTIGNVARNGYFADLKNVNYIDFEKDWWNQKSNEAMMFYDKLFFSSSDFSLRDKNRVYILAYNCAMIDELKLDDPVELVRNDTWTFDKMSEMAIKAGRDLNGDLEIDANDRFGIGTDSNHAFSAFLTGMGNSTITKNSEGVPEITLNNEHTFDSVEKFLQLKNNNQYAITIASDWNGKVDYDYWSSTSRFFYEGRELFITTFPHMLKQMYSECDFEYGIVPFPKYDESQKDYLTLTDAFSMYFGIPVIAKDYDFSGFMLEALSYYSTDTTLDAYYEISCKTKYTYNEDSKEMLDLIFNGARFDFGIVYNISGLRDFLYNFVRSDNTFVSDYKSIEEKALKSLDALKTDLQKAGNSAS